ncbi:Mpo1-like protein [Pseudidiomarina sp. PP-1MA]|uniref:Mpo1-like protein n=1 Tax=Pseudidiomarina sp. PP-1MA TaxID=3237706 RepID=A0AB39XCP0_9GAMM
MNKRLVVQFKSFAEFYPYYLAEHANPKCRAMHYIGSSLVLAVLAYVLITQQWWGLVLVPVIGYGFAWLGHFVFEHNKPATFKYPAYSLLGDWVMYGQFLQRLVGLKRQSS